MDRAVRQIDSGKQTDPQPFSAYDGAANIVLLGDPGSGKTHTFREAAARCGAQLVTARAFLVSPASHFEGTLFIDGLDEKRAGRGDRDTVDELVEKLFAVGADKVRISCRAADWLGDTDLSTLRPYFEQSGEPIVLHLGRLTEPEQRTVLQARGLSTSEAHAFILEAVERNLGEFLENPQNLIMLLGAVGTGTWPATRRQLFELSTQLMLKEFDKDRARTGSGSYSVDEVRPAAGAACAVRLISDIEAISLVDNEDSQATPSYRTLSMVHPELMLAALSRRVFVAAVEPETVDYAHRTTAEYLGAAWLADAVRQGLPIGRLLALIGIDAQPATELRGLNAWLAVHLPEHADTLIDADPYGVLTYGDLASLPKSSCTHLLKALGRLSQKDPLFRSGDWQSAAIGALSRADMVEEFRDVLRSDSAGLGVRSIVIEAAALGVPMPALKDELATAVVRTVSPYAERLSALKALLRIGPEGEAAATETFDRLERGIDALKLRAELIHRMYGKRFGPADVLALLKELDVGTESAGAAAALLFEVASHMPAGDIPIVLDGLRERPTTLGYSVERELERFVDQVLVRAWREIAEIKPARAMHWLRLGRSYLSRGTRHRSQRLREAIIERKGFLNAIIDHFFDTLIFDGDQWRRFTRFREFFFQEVSPAELLVHVRKRMLGVPAGSDREAFLYEAALTLAFSMDGPAADAAFEQLFDLADNRADLRALRDRSTSCAALETDLTFRPSDDFKRYSAELRAKFEKETEAIRNGRHLGWLTWAAKVYFGKFYDTVSPRQRLINLVGQENANIALAGFVAMLSRSDLPTFDQVVELSARNQLHEWWYAVAAGLIEQWESTEKVADASDDLLKAMSVFYLVNPFFEQAPKWKAALMQDRPELVRDAYIGIVCAKLEKGTEDIDGFHELMADKSFEAFRGDTALQLLRKFPNALPYRLNQLFDGIFKTPAAHSEFLVMAREILSGTATLGEVQHDKWLAALYLLAPVDYAAQLEAAARQRSGIVFDLLHRTRISSYGKQALVAATLPQMEFLARVTGTHFPQVGFPPHIWYGNTSRWDASEYCRGLINAISAVPSRAASEALKRLESDSRMESYNIHLRHALANQDRLRREAEYDRPDWRSTISALSGGTPASVADLHALLVDQLDDLRKRVPDTNTDIYKQFWNLDRHAKLTEPRPEDACRDALVTMLRPYLAPKGVTVEPEGHMAADKRADILVGMPARKVPCELKRDYHAELWTAADKQLEALYTRDPDSKGFGVYVVFWFGDKRPRQIPKHPDNLGRSKSAAELEQMLRDRISVDRRTRLGVIVIDVSGPSS